MRLQKVCNGFDFNLLQLLFPPSDHGKNPLDSSQPLPPCSEALGSSGAWRPRYLSLLTSFHQKTSEGFVFLWFFPFFSYKGPLDPPKKRLKKKGPSWEAWKGPRLLTSLASFEQFCLIWKANASCKTRISGRRIWWTRKTCRGLVCTLQPVTWFCLRCPQRIHIYYSDS